MGVTADRSLIVAEFDELVVYNDKNERRVLFTFPERLVTPPVLTANGELLVAGIGLLYSVATQ